ncbi:MAG TPA: MliC family protein, partial [Lysobacter sp.]|nr:MliC family protein [Lysobacter sp.]
DVTLATTTLEDVAGPPYDFALQYDPAKLRADGRYALAAVLRGADGAVLFTTPAPVPVKTGDANIVEFRMVRAGAGDVPQPAGQLQRTHWTCDGMTLDAAFDTEGRRVELALPDGMLSLPLAISASGARYLDHRGNEFWTTGDRGTFTREGGKKVDCVRRDASAAGSPWEDAKMRGIAFRAIGTEPGWMLEVSRGARPTLHAELDYGERVLDVAALQPLSGPLGYVGAAADGARVRLVLERRACSDGMSDERYPVAVQLQAGDRSYLGCGRFLGD